MRKAFPPKPTTRRELAAAIRTIAIMRRPRTVRQEARQYEVFQMHVVGRTRLSTVARQLGISMHTASSDLYHEGRRRADELEGTFVPYSLAKPEIVVKKADLAAMLESWGTIKTA